MSTLENQKNSEVIKGNSGRPTWPMEILMERLRSKASNLRVMQDDAKLIKQSILNKQHIIDASDKAALGKCLDKLQQNIKVTCLSTMVVRLEASARQIGLKFTAGPSGTDFYMSCDMFYVEVHLQDEGKVLDVKVELAGDQNRSRSSPELVECLSTGNFTDFMTHLEGFLSIYQLNTENKSKAYQALQSLETDLLKLFEMAQETLGNDTQRLVLKSPVGLLLKRKGGHHVKMIYFNSPYELLDVATQCSVSLTYETASTYDLDYTVFVVIEPSTQHKLQTTPLVNIKKGNDGIKLPSILGLNTTNSISLPATFSLKLKKPMAISLKLAQKLTEVTGLQCYNSAKKEPLLSLIVKEAMGEVYNPNSNSGLFVTLPDQQHCYFMSNVPEFDGVLINSIPFTHPTSVAHILEVLRIQAVFNSLIVSCVRPESSKVMESAFIFEVSSVGPEFISVTFEHPKEESTATAEFDLTDFSNVKCKLYTLKRDWLLCSDEYATKVLQRCLSIPITMRAVLRRSSKIEKDQPPQSAPVIKMESNFLSSEPHQNNPRFCNGYSSLGSKRDPLVTTSTNNIVTATPLSSQALFSGEADAPTSLLSSFSTDPVFGSSLVSISSKGNNHFLANGKNVKVKKRKSGPDYERKIPKLTEDVVINLNEKISDSVANEAGFYSRRDVKFEKVQNLPTSKRRLSSDSSRLTDSGTFELAALREKVYGAGSAANFAKFSYMHTSSQDEKDFSKKYKRQKLESPGQDMKKAPIILDVGDVDRAKKCATISSASLSAASVSSMNLSAALLKRPGIEIIPIPGSNTPISIPSSITVTPVIKGAEDRFKDKKDKKDKKDVDRKEKKRKTEGSRSPTSSLGMVSKSKIQIISSSNVKQSIGHFLDNSKEAKSLNPSVITEKPATSAYISPVKKPSLSPTISKPVMQQTKVGFSPTHKGNKLNYSPTQPTLGSPQISPSLLLSLSPTSSSKGTMSPKHCSSPKHSNVSPKHSSIGKPSMNALKSSSSTFQKPCLSPKLNKSGKEKDKRANSSKLPSQLSLTAPTSPTMKCKTALDKQKTIFSEALTITKVSTGETIASCSVNLSPTISSTVGVFDESLGCSNSVLMEKLSMDKAKASPPKNRKGSSLSDIVDKLRAGVSGTSGEPLNREKSLKSGADTKKEGDNFTIKSSTGLKFTINKSRQKEGGGGKSNLGGISANPKGHPNKSTSGLKPGVMSAPASKKVSTLPPIPKLSSTSVSNVTSTSVSPLGGSHIGSLLYGREREKEKVLGNEKKQKDSPAATPEMKKDSLLDKTLGEITFDLPEAKQDHSNSSTKKLQLTDAVDKALKDIFGEEENCQNHIENPDSSPLQQKTSHGCSNDDKTKELLKAEGATVDSAHDISGPTGRPHIFPGPSLKLRPPDDDPSRKSRTLASDRDADDIARSGSPKSDSSGGVVPPSSSPSSSVSIKIVKSPAPPVTSPLTMISPQSVSSQRSPCVIDDELMDEALMGSRK